MLPSFGGYIEKRPGKNGKRKEQYIPSGEYIDFWLDFYEELKQCTIFDQPLLHLEDKIDPYFGYFGFRFHPNTHELNHFHTGISITDKPKRPVVPVCDGLLEYSGFDVVNGFYVFLSHPHIQTEDGYIMYSLYMHLKKPTVKFSSYQKMLREISFNNYPKVAIERGTKIGEVGSTGIPDGKHYHLYLQIEFRHPQKNNIVLIDPLRLFGFRTRLNRSADFKNEADFYDLPRFRKNELKKLGIEGYFKT
jgi:murein DD-endopeptidase MepM/ murein hydrolase activator NlpD